MGSLIIPAVFWSLVIYAVIKGCAEPRPRSRSQRFHAHNNDHPSENPILHELQKRGISESDFSNFCKEKHARLVDAIVCPITLEVFTDPVLADGHTFEREALQQAQNIRPDINPLTGQETHNKHIYPNFSVQNIILGLIEEYQETQEKHEHNHEYKMSASND